MGAYGEMNKAGAAYASALFEHGQDGVGGTPWGVRDRYIEELADLLPGSDLNSTPNGARRDGFVCRAFSGG